jgi:hypothetical protein
MTSNDEATERLFSYGTLQRADVQQATFKRLLDGQADALLGCEVSSVPIADPQVAAALGRTHHANLTFNGRDDSRVVGTVFAITTTELAAVDEYERRDSYVRVVATLASGTQTWVYVHRPNDDRP